MGTEVETNRREPSNRRDWEGLLQQVDELSQCACN